ncbi:MAG: serpin family protein [Bacteroidales bacterium]|jgi:serpin B|nr:serpin family protein [Bacteroidales bacterium]
MKNMTIGLSLILIAGITTSVISCERTKNETPPGDPVQIELTLKQAEVVESANKFAFDLFVPVISEKKGAENIMISPFSVTSALSMTLNGAAGETFEAMMTALRYDGKTIGEINETYLKLMKDMVPVDPRVVMEIANSVWVEKRLTVKKSFIDALKNYYLAEARDIDVTDPGAVDEVNSWIEDKTHDKIQDMLDELSPDLAMLLINAVYFKGKWRNEFDKDVTANKPFYATPGSPVQVPMMFQNENFAVTRSQNATLVELPYGQGNYSMVVMLPDEGVSTAVAASTLTPENWVLWMADLARGTTDVDLSLPRFKYEYKRELKNDLTALGMGIAFTDFADFSNISEQGMLISRVLHQTFIETNEEGTEAAAATVVEMVFTSMPMTTVVNVNRPFLYFIRETTTGTIIFMGQVADPSKG